ncbi:unnamed protein product, partial [Oppiella nova]
DLSDTSISKLPTLGLHKLETLKLQNIFTLKEIPSVVHFREIRTAYLTYPYHCCAFKFPAIHTPKEYARYHLNFDSYCPDKSQTPHIIHDGITNQNQPLFVSLYRVTSEKASHYARKLLSMFTDDDNLDHTSGDLNEFKFRHLGEFGHMMSAGTRSPMDSTTIYGKIVYNLDDNYTNSYNNVLALQQDGPTGATLSTKSPPVERFGDFAPNIPSPTGASTQNNMGSVGQTVDKIKDSKDSTIPVIIDSISG